MRGTSRFRSWARGWPEFARRGDIAAYAGRGVGGRLGLDARALARALCSFGFVGAALACIAVALAAQILAWEWDLRGWRRDGLLCLPVLLAAPWVAAARRRHVEALVDDCGRSGGSDVSRDSIESGLTPLPQEQDHG